MRPEDRDAAYLWDMLDAARTITDFVGETTLAGYLRDRKLQLAVEREVEIIGEAARRLSDAFRESHPEVPWSRIIAQRNVLAHEYGEIRQDRMYLLATVRIPELKRALESLLPPLPGGD
ncbi:MAG: DUF86 domain-containing protein [Armatimonadota bacterium]|nr:DUF86 domain-containing protein [Armatimonadota bacterium]